ncbi:MAG: hypothetical protein ACE5KT_05040 [Methanosarcinales archaeon]
MPSITLKDEEYRLTSEEVDAILNSPESKIRQLKRKGIPIPEKLKKPIV